MKQPRICAAITSTDLRPVRQIEHQVDLFEVRIDLIGNEWQEVVRGLHKPWIACNRSAAEGGAWKGNEARRIERLLQAMELGAEMIDIELRTKNLANIVKLVRRRARCLLSYHDLEKTPPFDTMNRMLRQQVNAGADVCKIVTTARSFEDNLEVLRLISRSRDVRVVAFAMGPLGLASRVLSPLAGGDFTYASVAEGSESAPGQITVGEMREVYGMMAQ